jgi:small subunit ribosomal protein S9
MSKTTDNKFAATGRRKTAAARVTVTLNGTGKYTVNGRKVEEYFPTFLLQKLAFDALEATGMRGAVDVKATVVGGGVSGQAEAVRLGIARALLANDESVKAPLRKGDMLTRDDRRKERKKYGQKGARARFQWTKR